MRNHRIASGIAYTESCGVNPDWNEHDWMWYIDAEIEKIKISNGLSLSPVVNSPNTSTPAQEVRGKLGKKARSILKSLSSKTINSII